MGHKSGPEEAVRREPDAFRYGRDRMNGDIYLTWRQLFMWGHIFNLKAPLVGADNTWALWTICIVGASAAIMLEQRYQWASKVTGALIALVLAIALSNFGIIPMESGVWDAVWDYVVPLSIPMLLMKCDIRRVGRDSGRILGIFLIGSVGTACGAMIGYGILRQYIPELAKLAGVFTATYIGGAVNFTGVGKALGVPAGTMSSATMADNTMMAICFLVLMLIPSAGFFLKKFPHPLIDDIEAVKRSVGNGGEEEYEGAFARPREISLRDIALTVSAAFVIVSISFFMANMLGRVIPRSNSVLMMFNTLLGNDYIWLSTISMVCATVKPRFFGGIRGTEEIGTFLIYIFFFVIGVPASVSGIIQSPVLLLYAAIIVGVNMLFCFVAGRFLHYDLESIILASNANIGGPTTAAAMAVSKGWKPLIGPSILVGIIGYVLGTYMGLLVWGILEF